ncbi:MAG: response regulator transcription factor [Alphaproteobacteria bacterium]|nr:response regulator transcription factor [Alphaproteobacteria bacterium]
MKILLVEDDERTASYVKKGAQELGHVVDHAKTGRDGLFLGLSETYDVMVVDRKLPGMDGLTLVKTLRTSGITTPVIFLTTLCGIDDRIEGLNAGGDDYLTKPFAFGELIARLGALVRRPPLAEAKTVLRAQDLEMDLLKRQVTRGGVAIELQPKEFQLLEFLMRHPNQVVTRTMLLEGVWDFHFDPKTTVVETHISRLRSKIDRSQDGGLIRTVRGAGYMLNAPAPAA